ncbi:DUF2484 family protein [Aliiroseovarius subalbicans]|uniref:DUF2484 family protein n=1 Tax=Aliiroseovarius subalbicans TaxID=2925840 RepID=UPI001F561D17|nr:DUF2484 family protein [Aliiroseovarius subalbicans]MCI2398146.1 DUF2484 family protein [Aliiroseovarius subalbicans]
MSPVLILSCLWVLAATLTALLPMRLQFAPGITLLIAAPILLGYIGYQHGVWFFIAGMLAFLSMFRNPLKYLIRRARGEKPELPK